jgi:cytidylate kinase
VPVLAVTREIGSLGTHIAQEGAGRLGYDFVRQEIIAEAARLYEADPGTLVATVEARPRMLEERKATARRHFAFVAAEVMNVALKDNVVILGRWSTLLLRGIDHVLRVRVCAPLEVRAHRLAERSGVSAEEAARRIQRSDDGIRARIQQFFDVAWDDPRLYDVTLSTERMSVEDAVGVLVYTLALPDWQPTDASRAALWDRTLAARVRAALKAHAATARLDITIGCRSGRLVLAGTVPDTADRDAVGRVAAGHAGIEAVENHLVVTQIPPP